jgi:lysophospholipase L1-like esterase
MYWYEDEVKALEKESLKTSYEPETIFYGSSSVRLWTTLDQDMAHLKPVNLGFGGSTLAACVWFFDRLMQPFNPKRLVVYAGDNDLGDGRSPEEVFLFFQDLVVKVQQRFGNTMPCYYVSLKPSPSRWQMADKFKYANNLIENEIIKQDGNWRFINIFKPMLDTTGVPDKQYFVEDGLHLSAKGYAVWTQVISSSIATNE